MLNLDTNARKNEEKHFFTKKKEKEKKRVKKQEEKKGKKKKEKRPQRVPPETGRKIEFLIRNVNRNRNEINRFCASRQKEKNMLENERK